MPFHLQLGGGRIALVDLDDYLDLAEFRRHARLSRRLSYLHNETSLLRPAAWLNLLRRRSLFLERTNHALSNA
jgi:hypothetical protein